MCLCVLVFSFYFYLFLPFNGRPSYVYVLLFWRNKDIYNMRSRVGCQFVSLSVPSIDSSNGVRLVCCRARREQQISIDRCGHPS